MNVNVKSTRLPESKVNGVAALSLAESQHFKPEAHPSYSRVLMTPELAAKLLERNEGNRRLKPSRVDQMVRIITNGKWIEDGNPIKIDFNGNVLDGQHRLKSIVKSGIAVYCDIRQNLAPEAYLSIDTGVSRSITDLLDQGGEKSVRTLAAVLRYVYMWEIGALSRMSRPDLRPTSLEKKEILDRYPELRNYTDTAYSKVINTSVANFARFAFDRNDAALSEWFFESLLNGLNLSSDMAVYLLRKRMIEDRNAKARLGSRDVLALTIKAWNAHRKGLPVRNLKFSDDEKFPEIL